MSTWRVSAVAHPFPFRILFPSAWHRFLFGETRVTCTHPPRPIPLNKEPQQCVDLIIPPSHGSHLKCLLYMDHPLFRSLLFICRGIDYNISNDIVILWSLPPPPGGGLRVATQRQYNRNGSDHVSQQDYWKTVQLLLLIIFYNPDHFLRITCKLRVRNPGSIWVSGKLPTYPSPKPLFCPKREVSDNVGLGEG